MHLYGHQFMYGGELLRADVRAAVVGHIAQSVGLRCNLIDRAGCHWDRSPCVLFIGFALLFTPRVSQVLFDPIANALLSLLKGLQMRHTAWINIVHRLPSVEDCTVMHIPESDISFIPELLLELHDSNLLLLQVTP